MNNKRLTMRLEAAKAVPLTCHGHSRPVTHLSFSDVVDDNQYYLISACKGVHDKLVLDDKDED